MAITADTAAATGAAAIDAKLCSNIWNFFR